MGWDILLIFLTCNCYRFTTEAALDGILKDVTEIWETALDAIDSSLNAYCSVRINDLHLPEYVLHPFRGLETDYKRHIFFKEHFDLLVGLSPRDSLWLYSLFIS